MRPDPDRKTTSFDQRSVPPLCLVNLHRYGELTFLEALWTLIVPPLLTLLLYSLPAVNFVTIPRGGCREKGSGLLAAGALCTWACRRSRRGQRRRQRWLRSLRARGSTASWACRSRRGTRRTCDHRQQGVVRGAPPGASRGDMKWAEGPQDVLERRRRRHWWRRFFW